VKPKLHNYRECGPRFHTLLHTSYVRDYWLAPLSELSSQGIMSSKKANNNPGLCAIKGHIWSLQSDQGPKLILESVSEYYQDLAPCQMLVFQPAFYLSSYILPIDPQGWLRSNKRLYRTISFELVGDYVSSYPSMSRNPLQPHSMLGGDIIQRLLVLLYQWRCSGGLKGFQSHMTVSANTHVLVWSTILLNFISTSQDSIYLSLKKLCLPF
jgi:hypothetical protein